MAYRKNPLPQEEANKYSLAPTYVKQTTTPNFAQQYANNVANPYVSKDYVQTFPNKVVEDVVPRPSTTVNGHLAEGAKKENNAAAILDYQQNKNNNGGGGSAPVVTSAPSIAVDPYANYYNQMINLYQQQLAEEKARQERVRQARIDSANKVYDTSMGNLNDAKDSSLRQAYIKHMQDQKALPQQMQAFGMSGGATETNLANMKNAYGNNRTNIMNEAMAQQRLIEQDRANAIADAEADSANYEASAVRDYNNGLIRMYESALDKMPTYSNTATKSQITKNPWYDVAVGYLSDGNSTDEVIAALRQQGVSDDIIDAILYNWESTI